MSNVTFYLNPVPPMQSPGLPGVVAASAVQDNVQIALQILAARGVTG